MRINLRNKNDGTTTAMVVCAIVFVVFSFLWLYVFQSDILSVLQHVLSQGKTHYNRLWGAILITTTLWILQIGVLRLTRLKRRTHALTWMPSMLVLAFLTSFGTHFGHLLSSTLWPFLILILLLVWAILVWASRKVQPFESEWSWNFFSRSVWGNLLIMALMMIGVAIMSNTDAVYHFRAHAEVALLQDDNEEALSAGKDSRETDANLMMLRIYALSRLGRLPNQLFEFPLVPTSDAMLPTTSDVQLQLYPAEKLYSHLGAIPRHEMRPMEYLRAIIRSGQAKPAVADYLLCGYLLDRDLDSFSCEISRYYTLNDSLPRYYREALVLYNHLRSQPAIIYHHPVTDVDYADYQKMKSLYQEKTARRGKLLESYSDSYWYYYDYEGN